MKDVLRGIPYKRFISLLTTSIMFSGLNSVLTQQTARLLNLSELQEIPKYVLSVLVILFGFSMAEFACDILTQFCFVDIENGVNKYYLHKLYYVKPEILKKHNTGYISGLVQSLAGRQCKLVDQCAADLPMNITFMAYYSILLCRKSLLLGLPLPTLYVVSTVFRIWYSDKFVTKAHLEYTESDAIKNRTFIDLLSNINTVQKTQSLDFADRTMTECSDTNFKLAKRYHCIDEPGFLIAKHGMFLFFPIALFYIYFTHNTALFNDIETLSILTVLCMKLPHNARAVYRAFYYHKSFKVSLGKIKDIVADKNVRDELFAGDFHKAEIKDCTYSYTDQFDSKVTIEIPHFEILRGDIVCIHGESGQGKTTLLHILSKEIANNNVYINGEKSNKRLDCAFIAQDTEILDMSLRDNLTLGNDIPAYKLCEYIEYVGMGDWFNNQENGLDTILGERGVFVSTGQRQRLNLIRGLLMKDKEIYLLDEPTSNVDDETERKLVELIYSVLKGKTVVIVTHRPAIRKICNKSYIFRNGVLHREF